jgi:hypothetical protein
MMVGIGFSYLQDSELQSSQIIENIEFDGALAEIEAMKTGFLIYVFFFRASA